MEEDAAARGDRPLERAVTRRRPHDGDRAAVDRRESSGELHGPARLGRVVDGHEDGVGHPGSRCGPASDQDGNRNVLHGRARSRTGAEREQVVALAALGQRAVSLVRQLRSGDELDRPSR
jgi:hypothetical protein